jgi:nanoRNase/pAp phosphatase (c-di-AMP/oligoRNAs hydrolase)
MTAAGAVGRAGPAVIEGAAGVAGEDPLLVAAVVVVGLGVLVALAALWRLYRRTPGERLVRSFEDIEDVDVLMHPNPDPDAMACAMGVATLAEEAGTNATLRYAGEIRHQENRAFRTVLEVDCEPLESAEDLTDEVVLVDHNEPRGFEGAETVDPYAVVDHHPGDGTGEEFTDVREGYGACATIVAEYFEALDADPGAENGGPPPMSAALATGLLFGILSDTNRLTRGCADEEFAASAYLYPGIDEDVLDRIANPQVDAEVLEVRARAIQAREVRAPFAVSDVGTVSNADAIPQAADELLQLEGVSAVVVFGDSDDTLYLSGRSHDDRLHMGEALDRAIGDVPDASAGGHVRMGGGQLSFEAMSIPPAAFSRTGLRERLFAVMSGER